MLKFGLVSEYSSSKGKAKVKFEDDNIVTDWLPIIYKSTLSDKDFNRLPTNTQVACIMDGDIGVILGAVYSDSDTTSEESGDKVWGKEFEDGTVIKYDQTTHKLTIKVTGTGAKVEVEGDVIVTGKINATGDIESDADVKVGLVSLKLHTHTAPSGGGATTPPA